MPLLDPYGNTLKPSRSTARPNTAKSMNLLYNHPYSVYHAGDFRYRPQIVGDTDKALNAGARMQYVNWSRMLFAQMSILDFAMELVCDWAIGEHYDIIYTGPDKKFGNAFEEWTNNTWANNCNILGGPAFNFRNTLKLVIKELFRDGDLLQVYTRTRSGFPQLQYVRAHRLIERNGMTEIQGGRFDGYSVSDGLIKNYNGVTVGFYVQDSQNEADDYLASTRDATLIFLPKYFDKGRGLPPLMPAILDAWSAQELDDGQQRRNKLETTLGVQIYNEYGEAPPDSYTVPTFDEAENAPGSEASLNSGFPNLLNPAAPPAIQPIIGGLQYLPFGKGEIKTLASNSPHDQLLKYMDKLETRALGALGVPHQLLFSPTDISRAPARGISEIFKKTVAKTQQTIETFILPAIVWAVGYGIASGAIPAPSNTEKWWNNIEFTRPAEFTLDSYNDGKQQMEFYRMGLVSRDDITTSRSGKRGDAVMTAKKNDVVKTFSAAIEAKKELEAMYKNDPEASKYVGEITVTSLRNSLELLTPNGLPEPPAQEDKTQDNETD